ncbi:hypothetical protein WA556_006690 [Blastocystis sp. ATCC 50177/Nand II]
MRNPFFHPYFYDYGGDKMELFHRLHMIGGYRMYVLSTDFGFNIPHKVTKMAEEYKLGKDEEPMFIQYEIFTHLFKNWDKGEQSAQPIRICALACFFPTNRR